jgi:hypothetical protein
VVMAALGALCRDHEVSRWRRADGAGPDEGGPRCKLTPAQLRAHEREFKTTGTR